MHIEIDRDNKRIVLTFVGSDEKELFKKMENVRATLETKYDGETKVILKSRLYVKGDIKEFDKFDKLKPHSIGCEDPQQVVPNYKILPLFSYALTEEDKTTIAQTATTTLNVNLSQQEMLMLQYTSFTNLDNIDYYLPREFRKHHVEHGRRFQRLRQKQWFKKK